MDSSPIERDRLNELAYERLSTQLKAGRFVPGEKLKQRNLAAEMGISPTPVREALARLVADQALEHVGHHSVRVPVMSVERFHEVRDLRLLLEGLAASHAAARATPADVLALEGIHRHMVALRERGDALGARQESERFHMGLYRLAGRPVLMKMIESLWLQCGPLLHALERHGIDEPRRQHPHLAVIRGLRRADGDITRRGVQEEIERTTAPMLRYLGEQDKALAAEERVAART